MALTPSEQISTQNPELFVVEGASAASSIMRTRNAKHQSVLALQGKPINAAKASVGRVRNDIQLNTLATELGCGTGDGFELEMLKYQQVLLLFDPDADGTHSCMLLQVFLNLYMPELLKASKVAVVRAPLMQFNLPSAAQPVYAYSPQHVTQIRTHLELQGVSSYQSTHFKGIASLNPDILRKLCINPDTRNQQPLSFDDTSNVKQILAY